MNIRKILREELYRQCNIDRLINKSLQESLNRLVLNESQESKSQSKAIKLAMQNGMDRERAEQFVRVDLRNDLSELRHSDTAKFALGCARLFFEGQLTDAKSISLLNQILGLITKKYYDKFDQNLNGVSMTELSEQFSKELEDIEVQNRNDVNGKQYANQGYKIVPINSFEEAKEYNKYMYSKSPWCITYMDSMWKNYTKDGYKQVYFCLKNDFENIEAPKESGNFKDDYGLSMISVIVDEDGKLAYSTTRWNHANGASGDHDLTVQEISDIVGVNFYSTFKPNTIFRDKINDALRRFKNGENPNEIFDNIIELNNGLFKIRLDRKFNFIDTEGNLLSNEWFDYVGRFNDGFAVVGLNNKYNFIDTEGNLLSDQWFDDLSRFKDGFAMVKLNGKWNFIDTNGNILSDQWFTYVGDFYNGVVIVNLNNKYNFIDTEGNLLSKQWFDDADNFNDGFAVVGLNNKYNFIDTEGNLLSPQWFNYAEGFFYGFSVVKLNEKWNFIDKNGNLLSSQGFDFCNQFEDIDGNYYGEVKINTKWYKIDKNGKLYNM